MKNKILLIVIIILLLILLIPIPMRLKDGGSIRFQALLYSITKYHKLSEALDGNYIDGIGVEVLGVEIFDSTDKIETHTVNTDDNEDTSNLVHNSFVGTVLEETTTYMIVEPNEDETERKSADKIRINYGTDHRDYLYGIGRKVIINYTGYIKETYPAQIDTDNILTVGYEEFELIVKQADNTHITKILNNTELYKNNSDYDLFYVGLDEVNVNVDNKTMTLEEALRSGKMTIDGILAKYQAESDMYMATYEAALERHLATPEPEPVVQEGPEPDIEEPDLSDVIQEVLEDILPSNTDDNTSGPDGM